MRFHQSLHACYLLLDFLTLVEFSFLALELEAVWQTNYLTTNTTFFERTSKRRKGFPSETRVKRGVQIVHGNKELIEKLGRRDLCPCGSGRSLQKLLPAFGPV